MNSLTNGVGTPSNPSPINTKLANGSHIGSGANSLQGSATSGLWEQYEEVQARTLETNRLLAEVIRRYEHVSRLHHNYVSDNAAEREFFRTCKQTEERNAATIKSLHGILNRDPHILVLIDGNGMLFSNDYMNQGEAGGRKAAIALHNAVSEWAPQSIGDCPSDVKIVIRVYANLRGLTDICARAGIVDWHGKVEDFARGFNSSMALCDFVDAPGGNCAETKIKETFKIYLHDYHCRQILLGCSQVGFKYAPLLEKYSEDGQAKSRVSLLEGVPISYDLASLPFKRRKFEGIFRENKICLLGDGRSDLPRRTGTNGLNAVAQTFSPIGTPVEKAPVLQTANQHLPVRERPLRQESISSAGVPSESGSGKGNGAFTWSAVARTNQHKPVTTAYQRENTEPVSAIKRNRQGYRLDDIPEYNRDEVQRIKALKLCNQKFLGINGCCHRPEKCPHRHDLRPSNADLKTLRVVARETPCKKGTSCDDVYCIYGHRCPFPAATEGSMRGASCVVGAECRFPGEMHNMDRTPAEPKPKTVLATGRF